MRDWKGACPWICPRLNPGMSVSDAFKAVMWANLAHLQANECGILAGADSEFLHQMRVALRRLRVVLRISPEGEIRVKALEKP